MKRLHAFVAMPFGKKTGPEGTVIDFNADYSLRNSLPDPTRLKQNQAALTNRVKATRAAWHDRKNTNRIRYMLAVNAYRQ